MRNFFFSILIGLLVSGGASIRAQVQAPGAPASKAPASSASENSAAMRIRIGSSVAALYGPWKFTVGDSPIDPTTHQPLWAEPGFDDSKWEAVDLTPKSGATDPVAGLTGYVPGWTARGHAAYWGYAWYRTRVHVAASPGARLALAGPSDVDDAYQAFDNGELLGSFGRFSGSVPTTFFSQPMRFPLPNSADEGPDAATHVLAFRVWMEPSTLLEAPGVGGMHNAPLLGEAEAVAAQYQIRWDDLARAYAGSLIEALFFSLLGVVALSLVLFDRSDRVYLWIGAVLLFTAADQWVSCIAVWTQWLDANVALVERYILFNSLAFAGWVMVWRIWFRQRRSAWIPWTLAAVAALLMVSNAIYQNLWFVLVSQPVSHAFGVVSLALRLALALLMLVTVAQGIREHGLEGWLVLPAVLLAAFAEFYQELETQNIVKVWFPFGVQITMNQVASLLLVAALSILLLRRLSLSLRAQRQMALDVKQAQEVQQVMLPETRTLLPGLVIETEYRPAREVGGDFFQIIPHPTDGSLLIVAGDVAGKGLKAGMLVALLVGAIRSTAEMSSDPDFVLQALNRRLMGRGDAQATCLAVRIAADGSVKLANAGHLPPYVNGEPLAIEGALPLGITEDAQFSEMRFNLNERDRLLLVSDGIAEATDADGNLFGFERTHELVRSAQSATHLAATAQKFGQVDDISVISVTRIAVERAAELIPIMA